MTRIRIHTRRAARFLGLSRRSLTALALLGASFALGRLALDALLPAAAMASQAPSSVATPALASANPIEGGVAAFDRTPPITPAVAGAPEFMSNPCGESAAPPDGRALTHAVITTDTLPALPVSFTTARAARAGTPLPCDAAAAQRSERISRLSGEFSRAVGRLARSPDEKQILDSLCQARRAAHALRAQNALPTLGARLFPLTPTPERPAAPSEAAGGFSPWLVSLAAWFLAGI